MGHVYKFDNYNFTIPLSGITDNKINVFGEFREESTGETGDYTTDFAVSNQHVYLYINSITGTGDVTLTGTSNSETDSVPITSDTETITLDSSTSQYYQSDKKWLEITNIDIPAGITGIDYDIGILGYKDLGNKTFRYIGHRVDAYAQSDSADFTIRVTKVVNEGSKKFSLLDLESMGVDSGSAGNQLIDNVRTGADDRSYNPSVGNIWLNNTSLCFKQMDMDIYWSSGENLIDGTNNEGVILRIEGCPLGSGISNVDFLTCDFIFKVYD